MSSRTPSTSHPLPSSTPSSGTPPLLPIPLPTPSPPLLLPSIDCPRYEADESSFAPTARPTRGFRADYGFVGTLDDEIRRDPKRYVGYGITETWDDMVEDMQGIPAITDVTGLSQRMTNFVITVRQDTDEIYVRMNDAQDERLLMSGQLNMLRRDRRTHARTARLMETEARLSHEAWVQSTDASDTTRSEIKVTKLQSQQGPAGSPVQPEILEEAGSLVTEAENGEDIMIQARCKDERLLLLDAIEFATEPMDKRSTLLLNDRVKTKEIKMITNNNNRTRGRTLAGFMLQGLTAQWLQNVTSATELETILSLDCRSTANANTANNQRGTGAGQKPTCYECGAQGHFKRDCPKLKNNNRGNQGGNGIATSEIDAVFLELSGLPPTRQVEFQIDLILGAHLSTALLSIDPIRMEEYPDQALKNFLI
ncbi:putative reverse transcriptase domain-containing protein [Tanacetum coccineum]